MRKVLCFVSNEMADFEIMFAFQIIKNTGNREIVSVGTDCSPVVSQAGFTYLPNKTLKQALELEGVEALIIPGGPIQTQPDGLTDLIVKLDHEKKLLAAICFGPQYLGRAGVLDHHPFTTSCSEDKIRSLQVPDPYPRHNYVEARVVCHEHVITAKGRAFVDFAFAIFDYLDVFSGRNGEKDALYQDVMNR
jgi:putative intracellular protease/amidase